MNLTPLESLTRSDILDCLRRQLADPFDDPQRSCGIHCTIRTPDGCDGCDLAGSPDLYSLFQSLLRDPSVPADRAAPLISALESGKRVFEDYDPSAPDHTPLLRAVLDLACK